MIYAILGLLIALAVVGGYAKIEHSGKLEAQAQTQALGARIEQQNAAVDALAKEGARKQAEGAKALAKANGRAKVWTAQAVRLQGILTSRKPTDPQDCKAAWQEIRK